MSNVSNRLSNVARILENRFFYENNRVLAEELKRLKQEEESVDALAKVSGIASKIVLTELVSLGVRPETVAALCLVPVIEVAWADGKIDAREIEAFVKGATKTGSRTSLRILQEWLQKKPDENLEQAWKHYMKGLCGVMDEKALSLLCDDIIAHARNVANASGGFLGLIDPVSSAEKKKLEEMREFLKENSFCENID
jgi:hypothetical protein